MASLHKAGQSRASAARKLSAIRSFTRFLRREGAIESDPAALAVSPKREQKVPTHLSVDEMSQLLEMPDLDEPLGRRDRAILELFYASGLRLSELVGLDLEDVNLGATRRACVRQGREGTPGALQYDDAARRPQVVAGSHGDRRVTAQAQGSRHKAHGSQLKAQSPRHNDSGEPLFTNARGGRLTGRSIERLVAPLRRPVRQAPRHQSACAAPFVCHAPAPARRRPARHSGTARPRPALDDGALHARQRGPAPRGVSESSPSGIKSSLNSIPVTILRRMYFGHFIAH